MKERSCNLYPSYKIRMNAEAVTARQCAAAVITDISVNSISILSKKAISPRAPIEVTFRLDGEILLRGNVWWVLDSLAENGEHFYQAGIKTDTIVHSNVRAVGMVEKSRLIQEILYQMIEKGLN